MLYTVSIEGITPGMLEGFFDKWPNPPSPKVHLKLLEKSDFIVLALDEQINQVVGFITAISDGVLSGYIPLLEVLPNYQNKGIGRELVQRMLNQLNHLYMIDIMCDENLQTYYEKFGMHKANGMILRNYSRQSGE